MVYIPPKKSIWSCNMDTEGRKNSCKFRCHNSHQDISKSPKHWFIIISDKNDQDFITALPFTSTPSQEIRNGGVTINSDDVTSFSKSQNQFNPNRLTLALCNKVCRIPREELQKDKDYGMLKKEKYNELVWEVKAIIREV